MVPVKALSDQDWIRYECLYEKYLFWIVGYLYLNSQKKNTLKPRTDNFFHVIDQTKISRVPLWIGYCYFCMEGHLKLNFPLKVLFSGFVEGTERESLDVLEGEEVTLQCRYTGRSIKLMKRKTTFNQYFYNTNKSIRRLKVKCACV